MKLLKLLSQGIIVAVIVILAILFSGLSTSSVQASDGTYRTFTTLALGGTEFIVLMVAVAFFSVVASGYLLVSLGRKKP
ncbi:MAG TPA: hypothetical protein VMB35_05325 [Methanomicrobiales archaeon]|nr:hypothetical protein [Methanomicrobiales archaeon]